MSNRSSGDGHEGGTQEGSSGLFLENANQKKRISSLESALRNMADENAELEELVTERENSLSWKLCRIFDRAVPPGSLLKKSVSASLGRVVRAVLKNRAAKGGHDGEKRGRMHESLARILEENRDACKGIILIPPSVEWNYPLFQRPHQLALVMAARGYLVFFCTAWKKFDTVSGFEKITDRCYLTDQYPLLCEELPPFYSLVPSIYVGSGIRELKRLKDRSVIIYDFFDEISDRIVTFPLRKLHRRHAYMLRNADIVFASADNLYRQATREDGHDVFLIPNGVDYSHFHVRRDHGAIPPALRDIVSGGRPVIGYYGALASWFDYRLVTALARMRPGYEIVLIGMDYDGSMRDSGLGDCKNIHVLGPVEYSRLPEYAVWFDAAIIPFVLNGITRGASPIKLFEYMALALPVVTTELPESFKYPPVFTAKDAGDFAVRIDSALACRQDPEYLALLDREARENTWESRAEAIDAILSVPARQPARVLSDEHRGFRIPAATAANVPNLYEVSICTWSGCTRKCAYCRYGHDPLPEEKMMSEELFEKILSDLQAAGFSGIISPFAGNEPLLDPRIARFTGMITEKLPHAKSFLFTNGDLLTEKKAQELFDAGLSRLFVSLHDTSREEELSGIARHFGSSRIRLMRFYQPAMRHKLHNYAGFITSDIVSQRRHTDTGCCLPFRQLVIGPDGDVGLCCADIAGNRVFRNARDQSVVEIFYHDPDLNRVRGQLARNNRRGIRPCENCSFCGDVPEICL